MRLALIVALLLSTVPLAAQEAPSATKSAEARPEGKAVRVPYRLTPTKHVLVRAKLNGRGPFNFIVDTGAPALFVSPEAARKAELQPDEEGWATVGRLEVEGGALLEKQEARVQEPPQLTGMNMVGLPGVRLDGVFGYGILARFRIEIDLTRRAMVWTPLGYEPLPLVPLQELARGNGPGGAAAPPAVPPMAAPAAPEQPAKPPELAALEKLPNLLGSLVPKKVEVPVVPRAFLGFELAPGAGVPRVVRVLPQSPAARAGVAVGDRITHVSLPGQKARAVKSVAQLQNLSGQVAAGETVGLKVLRGKRSRSVSVRGGAAL